MNARAYLFSDEAADKLLVCGACLRVYMTDNARQSVDFTADDFRLFITSGDKLSDFKSVVEQNGDQISQAYRRNNVQHTRKQSGNTAESLRQTVVLRHSLGVSDKAAYTVVDA